jgi:hypothetical protein
MIVLKVKKSFEYTLQDVVDTVNIMYNCNIATDAALWSEVMLCSQVGMLFPDVIEYIKKVYNIK